MTTHSYYPDEIDFSKLSITRQQEILQTKGYNAVIHYFKGKHDDITFLGEIERLAHHNILTFQELIDFLKSKIIYEAYQNSFGKSASQIEELKRRVRYIKNL